MRLALAVTFAAHREPGCNGARCDQSEPLTQRQPIPGKSSTYHSACGVLQALRGRRRVARPVTIMLSALLLLLTTAGTCGAFPQFDSCPERAAHAQQEHAADGLDHQGTRHGHPLAPLSHPDPGVTHASPDGDGGYCECCKGFFMAHLSAISATITVAIFPEHSAAPSGLRHMALEFVSAPPVPPPQPYQISVSV